MLNLNPLKKSQKNFYEKDINEKVTGKCSF
jgi:hypothetical protein